MILGASLLKDTDCTGNPEVDELRAELIKQKILFEAELRRQREISDERFLAMQRQMQTLVEDNGQLRNTLHALGERLSLLEHRDHRRSASPALPQMIMAAADGQHQQTSTSQRASQPAGRVVAGAFNNNNVSNSHGVPMKRYGSAGSRHQSPVPRVAVPQPISLQQQQQQQPKQYSAAQFVKIRPSPSTTPKTTPRGPVARTTSAASSGSLSRDATNVSSTQQQQQQQQGTSPAHIPFRPVLRSQPFRSPLRQHQLQQLGKPMVNTGQWR